MITGSFTSGIIACFLMSVVGLRKQPEMKPVLPAVAFPLRLMEEVPRNRAS